jgi:mRNA interferase MazF
VKRGDVVTVAASDDYGKPRPAVILQTDALPAEHVSVVVCQMTSDIVEAPDFRVIIEPNEKNGLRTRSQIMADKPVTIRRERIGSRVGSLDQEDLARLNVALAFVVGLAD